MKRIFSATLLAAFALMIVACNTIKGVGQDVQKAGEKIEDAAKKK
jgi:predicted small secreted protein